MVWAHPRRGSFSEALRHTTEDALIRAGHQVQVVELYQEGFPAIMGEAEWQAYRDFRPAPDAQLERHIDALRRAEQLVFIYPTWWFGLPAMLKGWLERTMVPGVAFDFDPSGQIRGNLGSLRRIVGIATYGSTPWYVHLIGDAGRRTLTRALRMSAPRPWTVRSRWLALYRLDSATDADRAAFLARVDRTLGRKSGQRSRPARLRRTRGHLTPRRGRRGSAGPVIDLNSGEETNR